MNKDLLKLGEKNTDYKIEHWLIMYEEPTVFGTKYDRLLSRHKTIASANKALSRYMELHPNEVFKIELD